ncbi:MAG: hypothetical protein MUE59_14580 [Thiobacillaceae bacterium]|nr:hypothetical protein [Thiobacillaceae bacterium]
MKALLAFARLIDALTERIGRLVIWLVLVATLISAGNALLRYTLGVSSNAWLEIQWYLFGAMFLLAASISFTTACRCAARPGSISPAGCCSCCRWPR